MAIKKIRNQYLSLFLVLSALLGIGVSIALYENYSIYRDAQKEELAREAYISKAMLDAVLSDAAKILDVAKPRIEQAINDGRLTDEATYKILQQAHIAFDSFITNTAVQLSLYIDENGVVRATSAGVEDKKLDLSDRLYFKTLKDNPKLAYAIGNLVKAKTNGILTFHIAVAILDKSGKFRGVITQQVAAEDLAHNLSESIKSLADAKILVNLAGGNIAFVYPSLQEQNESNPTPYFYIEERVHVDGKTRGVVEIAATKEFPQEAYVGYAVSEKYGLVTTVSLTVKKVISTFIRDSYLLITFVVFAFFLLAYILWRFYKTAIEIATTLMISFTDALTGMQNRRSFDTQFPRYWKDALRSGQPISALFIDIDHFKRFNDDYGHECGDLALIAVAGAITHCVSRPLDFSCRWGGEEFAVLLPQTNERGAIQLANEILITVRAIKLGPPCVPNAKITVSIGIASMVVTHQNKTDDLIDMSDKAMYIAKQSGRDRYAVFDRPLPEFDI